MRRGTTVLAGVVALVVLTGVVAAQQLPDQPPGPPEARQGRGPERGFRPPVMPLMAALDANKDGELSAEEIEGAVTALKKLDKNSDGKVDREELRPQFGRFGMGPGPGGRIGEGGPGPGPGMGPPPGRPPRGGIAAGGAAASLFDQPPVPKDSAEEKILGVLDDLDRNQRRGMMNVPKEDGRLLRLLTEAAGAKQVVEIGTSNGYSGIWFCLALRATGGRLTTFEINQYRASLAREDFKRAGVDQMVTLVEGDAHVEVAKLKDPIDVLFLDADKEGYVDYLEKLLPLVRPGGLVLAHNMNPRQADPRYVKAITTNPDLETIFLHMQGAGVGVTLKKR